MSLMSGSRYTKPPAEYHEKYTRTSTGDVSGMSIGISRTFCTRSLSFTYVLVESSAHRPCRVE